jgi:hypothetical protein
MSIVTNKKKECIEPRTSIEDVKAAAEKVGFKLVDEVFKGYYSRVNIKCVICNTVYEISYSRLNEYTCINCENVLKFAKIKLEIESFGNVII